MGNNDSWYQLNITWIQQMRFYLEIGEMPMGHKVINGFHFINWAVRAEKVKQLIQI